MFGDVKALRGVFLVMKLFKKKKPPFKNLNVMT
jgi:hypothetical protein